MEALLKASEAAALMGVSARWVQVQLQQSAREEPLLKAVGDIDIGRMNENIIRQRGGIEDGKDL